MVSINKGVIKTYPNPVTNMLNVSVLGEINGRGTIQIVDQNGIIVLEQKVANNPQVINVARLAKGVYLLKLNDGSNNMTSKFVKE